MFDTIVCAGASLPAAQSGIRASHQEKLPRACPAALEESSEQSNKINRRNVVGLGGQNEWGTLLASGSYSPITGQISKAVADQERFTDRRSSSQESPRGPSALAPSRQKSCPAPFLRRLSTIDLQDARDPQEVSWAERRRVRMIQRH
ncbi:unnamed protein product [Nesidiocoris tenuis]|uniref:Uncharacterized protein n=1 Tax=Nesidiocoris tenuis TaxID=355587 RepID=A0A6H5HJZ1_9HEMI|nr:unnamed protein product [Nesidiocoris tenuis]